MPVGQGLQLIPSKLKVFCVAGRAQRPLLLRALRAEVDGDREGQRGNGQERRYERILACCRQLAGHLQLVRVAYAACVHRVGEVRRGRSYPARTAGQKVDHTQSQVR